MSTAEHLRVIEGDGGRAPSAPPPDPLIGRTLDGRYLVESVLGEGGMGIVYRARHTVLGKQLAIKVLRAEVSKDSEIMERFRQEAQSATSIGNEHIIDISDFGTLPDGSTYFVMEFLNGDSLTHALEKERPLPAARTVRIAKQLARALGAAHERGIVHRDLKPDNIYLIHRGQDKDFVKVLDFGIAKVGGASSKLTRAGQVFGTPHYMSPEQCAGTNVDQRTDIYAVGVILYEMASGRVPFDADNLMGILTKHLYEQPIRPHELPPPVEVPPALEAVIMKCLAKAPEQRYQSMNEMYADLERIEAGLTPQAVMDEFERTSAGSAGGYEASRGGLAVDVGGELPAQKSKMGLIVGIVIAVLALGGGGAYFALKPAETTQTEHRSNPPVVTPPVVTPPVVTPPATTTPEVVMVTLTSSPEGAEVYEGENLLGNTPIEMPRPTGPDTRQLQLRKAGYENFSIRLFSGTGTNVNLTLVPVRVAPVASSSGHRRPPVGNGNTSTTAPANPPPANPPPAQTRSTEDIINPWNN